MTRTLTISSGAATPNAARTASVAQGLSGMASSALNGISRQAEQRDAGRTEHEGESHTCTGGPGRSSAAITSHSTSSAGAIAAAPITVGSDSSNNMGSICSRERQKWPQTQHFARVARPRPTRAWEFTFGCFRRQVQSDLDDCAVGASVLMNGMVEVLDQTGDVTGCIYAQQRVIRDRSSRPSAGGRWGPSILSRSAGS